MGSHSATSQSKRPRQAPQPDPSLEQPFVGSPQLQPGRPRPRRPSAPRLLRWESATRPGLPPPRASRPGSRVLRRRSPGPGRSGVRETAQREKSWAGRAGKEGSSPAPLGASATRRRRSEQSREHNSPRLAHPPQRAPAAPEPEAGPSLVPAHAAPHSQSPQRRLPARAVPPLTFLRRLCPAPLSSSRPSGLQTNGSAPLLHKRAGAGPRTGTAGRSPASPSRPLSRCGPSASLCPCCV